MRSPKPEATAPVPPSVEEVRPPGASVVVIGPPQGRWRIGRHFGPDPVTIPFADLSDDDQARLAADPMLSFRVIDAPY